MSQGDFNPNSHDSMFARILARLEEQNRTTEERHAENKKTLEGILTQTKLTNGRVTKLEKAKTYFVGWVAGASVIGGLAWKAVSHFLGG